MVENIFIYSYYIFIYQNIHFDISAGLIYTLNTIIESINNSSTLELWFNVDGLPIDKRGKSFWPILCNFWVNNSIMKPFIVGAYFE